MEIWIARTKDEGNIAASLDVEIVKAHATEQGNAEDYYGKPVFWKCWNAGTPQEHWVGTYNDGPHDTGSICVERLPLLTRMPEMEV